MIPIYRALQEENIPTFLCSTGQHASLLTDALKVFEVTPDVDLKIMKPDQDLAYVTEIVLNKTKELFKQIDPTLVIVQGDTTSAMSAALAAFYLKIPVVHVEAGLRSGNIQAPFPEEMNRRVITLLASLHFAPTETSVKHLLAEGIKPESVFCTGNTVVDSLQIMLQKLNTGELIPSQALSAAIANHRAEGRKILLLTAHRRESFNGGLKQIFSAVKKTLADNPNLFIIYPMHPNPVIQKTLQEAELHSMPNILVTEPLPYSDLVYVLNAADGVLTDSGGIQEEAVSLNKPVLVLRNETDRPEGIQEGFAILVGTDEAKIVEGVQKMITQGSKSQESPHPLPYGDGQAAKEIVRIIKKEFLTQEMVP